MSELEKISIRVVSQDGGEVLFQMKKTTPIKRVMDAYCQRMGLQRSGLRFLYDGQRIGEEQTAEDLKMQDRDIVDAVLQQVGGSFY